MRPKSPRAVWSVLATALALAPAAGYAGAIRPTYLTEPSPAAPRAIALGYLAGHAAELGLTAGDVADVAVSAEVPSRHNGLTHLYLRQRVAGLEVDGAELGVHVDAQGRILHLAGGFVADAALRAAALPSFPRLGPEEAVEAAARQLGLGRVDGLELIESAPSVDRYALFANAAVSEDPIPVRLRYLHAADGGLRLTWSVVLNDPASESWWQAWVDAGTGELVARVDWTAHANYRVFASPGESPYDGDRTDQIDPHDLTASPFGWHDLNGVPGHETTLTSGNNVNACADSAAPGNVCDPGGQPDGGAMLIFQPPLDLDTQQPADYQPAAVVNLYYWNNIMHDVLYQYGFDEPAGNFQENNYGNGGAGSDSVNADAQDLSGTNNANFATPPDGSNPRMQMFVWSAPLGLQINAPAPIAGTYAAGTATFGPQTFDITEDLVLVNDGSGAFTDDGCCNDGNTLCVNPVWPGVAGKIALLKRGQCEFGTKTVNAQNAGAIGVVLINIQGDGTVNMGPGANGGLAVIPIVSVGLTHGNLFIDNLPGVNATMDSATAVGPDRDSDLDNGVIAHEYGHGVSNRLTGGPANVGCLNNQEQMGEGWSDWMTLFLHADPADTATTPRAIGTYVSFHDGATGQGIRRFPYNTDNTANPLTYGDIVTEAVPHGVGAVWANMLWEMYWNLIGIYGYDPDIYHGTGGNNVAFQLSIDGMKLQPCSPGFVNGRDAILAADVANYGGENVCEIWRAFAERGVGVGASQGSSNVIGDEVETFTLPAECVNLIFADGVGTGSTNRWSSTAN